MESKLNLNRNLVDKARESARRIAEDTQNFIDLHTTVTVERAVCRLLGIDGVNALEVPLPNVVVDHLFDKGLLPGGAAYYIGNAMAETGMNPQQIAESIDRGELDLSAVAPHSIEEIRAAVMPVAEATAERIRTNVAKRNDYLNSFGDKTDPYLYVIVATGNIYEDIVQAKAAAKQGADIIAVIRTTGQSLLDYVPYGATTEGFGGTYATQENFRLMRAALDEVGEQEHRYIRLCNYCSGLCMPEIAAMYTIVPQPAPFHMSVITIIGRNMLDVVRNGIFSPPIWTIRLLTMPVLVDSRLYSIDITITHDMKCGRYSMVCIVRL